MRPPGYEAERISVAPSDQPCARKTVGVLVAAALPRAVWIAEIDLHVGSDGDPGVLILSRFVGAAINFRRSVLVNPYDAESVANALAQALAMRLRKGAPGRAEEACYQLQSL
jgi:hypothetical protein